MEARPYVRLNPPLLWLRGQLPDQVIDTVVINTGEHAYRRTDGVAVIPLALIGP